MKNENTLPDYGTNDPKGWCGDPARGAAMGRLTTHDTELSHRRSVKLVLRKVRLNQGGYDSNGTYFGCGEPLYWYADSDGTIDAMTRADNRTDAKRVIRGNYPNARFYC